MAGIEEDGPEVLPVPRMHRGADGGGVRAGADDPALRRRFQEPPDRLQGRQDPGRLGLSDAGQGDQFLTGRLGEPAP